MQSQLAPTIIILIGVCGVGKATLGLMASCSLNYQYCDAKNLVSHVTKVSDYQFLQDNSLEDFQKLQARLIISYIKRQTQNSCIVLPASIILNKSICNFLQNQPYVISIERERSIILQNSNILETNATSLNNNNKMLYNAFHINAFERSFCCVMDDESFSNDDCISSISEDCDNLQLLNLIAKFRQLAKYNYFNLKSTSNSLKFKLISTSELETLTLKDAQLEFNYFLKHILGIKPHISTNRFLNIANSNKFSCTIILEFPSQKITEFLSNIHNAVIGCDTINININIIKLVTLVGIYNIETNILKLIAKLRRKCILPIIISFDNTMHELRAFLQKTKFTEYSNSVSVSDIDLNSQDNTDPSSTTSISSNTPNRIEESIFLFDKFKLSHLTEIEFYFKLISFAIKIGAEYVNLDFSMAIKPITQEDTSELIITDDETNDIKEKITQLLHDDNPTTLIGVYHSNDPKFWVSKDGCFNAVELANELGFQLVCLTSVATELTDNLDVWNFLRTSLFEYPNICLSAFIKGEIGRLSKILNRFLTPVYFYNRDEVANLNSDKLNIFDVQRALQHSFILPVNSFYMIGMDLSFTLMPSIQNFLFFKLGVIHTYNPFQSSSLNDLQNIIKSPNFGGAWILPPFTEDAFQFANVVSQHAKSIGSINLLVVDKTLLNPIKVSHILGENIDWLAITELLEISLSPINLYNDSKSALVIGTCHTIYASVYALIKFGFRNVIIYDTDLSQAEKLKFFLKKSITSTENCTLHVINHKDFVTSHLPHHCTLPSVIIIGTTSNRKKQTFPLNWVKNNTGGVLIDISTYLLNASIVSDIENEQKGWITINGLNFLAIQACIHFEYLVRKPIPRPLVMEFCLQEYQRLGN